MDSPLTERFKYFFTKVNIVGRAGRGPLIMPVELHPLPVRARWGYEAGSLVIKAG